MNQASRYTYVNTRKLGRLIPVEAAANANKEVKISQVVINQIKMARGECFWTSRDVMVLRKSALCEISHYYQALKENLPAQNKEAKIESDRELIALEIMKGLSVDEAFRKHGI